MLTNGEKYFLFFRQIYRTLLNNNILNKMIVFLCSFIQWKGRLNPLTPSWSQILSKNLLNNFPATLRFSDVSFFNFIWFKSYDSLKNVRLFCCISATWGHKGLKPSEVVKSFSWKLFCSEKLFLLPLQNFSNLIHLNFWTVMWCRKEL